MKIEIENYLLFVQCVDSGNGDCGAAPRHCWARKGVLSTTAPPSHKQTKPETLTMCIRAPPHTNDPVRPARSCVDDPKRRCLLTPLSDRLTRMPRGNKQGSGDQKPKPQRKGVALLNGGVDNDVTGHTEHATVTMASVSSGLASGEWR